MRCRGRGAAEDEGVLVDGAAEDERRDELLVTLLPADEPRMILGRRRPCETCYCEKSMVDLLFFVDTPIEIPEVLCQQASMLSHPQLGSEGVATVSGLFD